MSTWTRTSTPSSALKKARLAGRHQEGLPQARQGTAPRPEQEQPRGRGEVQGGLRGLLGARRRGRRKEYDEGRELFGSGGFRPPVRPRRLAPAATNFDFNFGGPGRTAAWATSSAASSTAAGGRAPRRGADVETEVTIGFAEAVEGVTVPLRLTSERACPACAGTGAKAGTMPRVCPACSGSGHISRNLGGFAMAEPCRRAAGAGCSSTTRAPPATAAAGRRAARRSTSASPPE